MALAILMGIASAKLVAGKVYHLPSWTDIFIHILYLPELLQRTAISDVYWTLCLEIQFYLSFSLLLVLVTALERRLGSERALDAVLIPATLISNLWALDLVPFYVHGLFVHFWFLFLLGVLVWRAVMRADDGDYAPTVVATLEIALLAAIGVARVDVPILVAAATGTVVLVGGLLGKLQTWLSSRPLQFLGVISYSLYLTHNQLTGAVFRGGFALTGRTVLTEALWLLVVVAISIAFAWLFFKLFEAPSMLLSRKVRMPDASEVPPPVRATLRPARG